MPEVAHFKSLLILSALPLLRHGSLPRRRVVGDDNPLTGRCTATSARMEFATTPPAGRLFYSMLLLAAIRTLLGYNRGMPQDLHGWDAGLYAMPPSQQPQKNRDWGKIAAVGQWLSCFLGAVAIFLTVWLSRTSHAQDKTDTGGGPAISTGWGISLLIVAA